MEFQLRLQEYVELVRQRKFIEAISYAKKYLASFASVYGKEVQTALALVAFGPDTQCLRYKASSILCMIPTSTRSNFFLYRNYSAQIDGTNFTSSSTLHILRSSRYHRAPYLTYTFQPACRRSRRPTATAMQTRTLTARSVPRIPWVHSQRVFRGRTT